jgi:pyridoxine kinase
VAPEALRDVLAGVEANGLFSLCDAVITGYFASPAQVEVAAWAIDQIRAAPRLQGAPAPLVMVDPIMGDLDVGAYVPPDVAAALSMRLAPRADLVACNLWEFRQLADCGPVETPDQIAAAALATGRDWLVTSAAAPAGIGAVLATGGRGLLASTPRLPGRLPRGAGDLLKLRFVGGLVSGETRETALARSVGLTEAVLRNALAWDAPELPIAASWPLVADPPEAMMEIISGPPREEVD